MHTGIWKNPVGGRCRVGRLNLDGDGQGDLAERIHIEIFNGSEPVTPGVVAAATRIPHVLKDDANTGPLVSFARSGIAAHWKASAYHNILELAERVTFRPVGRAAPVCVIAVRAVWSRERLSTDRSRSTTPPTETFSFAAHKRFAMSSSICEAASLRP